MAIDDRGLSGRRLRQLRLARGWSLEELAAQAGYVVTKQAISKYERGAAYPSALVLRRLAAALGVAAASLWREPVVRIAIVAYRRRASLAQREREAIESAVSVQLEERVRLQMLLGEDNRYAIPAFQLLADTIEDAERAAEELRQQWHMGVDPIARVVDLLEQRHCHIIELDSADRFDGLAATATNEDGAVVAGAIVNRRGISGDRQRLSICHELGHLVLKVSRDSDGEKLVFRFASAFLAPASALRDVVGGRRTQIGLEELVYLKKLFGMSMQAILYRLRNLAIISEAVYRQWCKRISREGWKKEEPYSLAAERPQWLERSLRRAMAEGLLTVDDCWRVGRGGVEEAFPPPGNRQVWWQSSLEQRRHALAEEAARFLAEHPEEEWEDLETGDFLDE